MTGPLDPAGDPDRFDPHAAVGPLDPALDPDRYDGSGVGQTLPGLLGAGAQEEPREGLAWVFGLLGVLGFLVLVTFLIGLRH